MLLSGNKSQSDCSRLVGATLEWTVLYNWDYAGIMLQNVWVANGHVSVCGNGYFYG